MVANSAAVKVSPVLGVIAATEEELPRFFRETARRDFGVGEKVRLLWVEPGYPAAQAGLQAGDVILEVGGKRLRSARGLYSQHSGANRRSPGHASRARRSRLRGSRFRTTRMFRCSYRS